MNNLERLKMGIIDLYEEHGDKNGFSPASISHMINEIDFFALYQCLRYSTGKNEVPHYFAQGNNGPAYSSNLIFPEEVFELCSVIDFEGKKDECRIRHSIELVVREDMSLAVLTCCETVIGDCEYCSAYRELKEEWPSEIGTIDLEKLHKRLMALTNGYEDGHDVFFEP